MRTLESIRARFPDDERVYVILDNLNHHKGPRVRQWAADHNVEPLFTSTYASWANPIECHFGANRYFVLKNCNYRSHRSGARAKNVIKVRDGEWSGDMVVHFDNHGKVAVANMKAVHLRVKLVK